MGRLSWELESRDAGWRTPPSGGEGSGSGAERSGRTAAPMARVVPRGPGREPPTCHGRRTTTPYADFVHVDEIRRMPRSDHAVVDHMDDNDASPKCRVANSREPRI